jgi:uncharacterized membrane protein
MAQTKASSAHNFAFWFHLLITVLAWIGPFLFSWYLMVLAYAIVIVQFLIFDRCLINAKHDLDTTSDEDTTFYSYLFEKIGYQPNRKTLKRFVRRYLYILLGVVAVVWQLILGFSPLFF